MPEKEIRDLLEGEGPGYVFCTSDEKYFSDVPADEDACIRSAFACCKKTRQDVNLIRCEWNGYSIEMNVTACIHYNGGNPYLEEILPFWK